MKKLNYLLLASLLSISIISCSSDESDNDINQDNIMEEMNVEEGDDIEETGLISENSIIGTWELTDYSSVNARNITEFSGESLTTTFQYDSSDLDYFITFNDNNTLIANGSYNLEVTTTTFGQSFSQDFPIESNNDSANWTLTSSNTLILSALGSDIDGEYDIIEISDSLLRLSLNFSDLNSLINEQTTAEGFTSSLSGNIILTLEK